MCYIFDIKYKFWISCHFAGVIFVTETSKIKMTKLLILIGALLGCLVLVQSCGTVLDAFKRHELIPDVLDDGPNSLLKVRFSHFNHRKFFNGFLKTSGDLSIFPHNFFCKLRK